MYNYICFGRTLTLFKKKKNIYLYCPAHNTKGIFRFLLFLAPFCTLLSSRQQSRSNIPIEERFGAFGISFQRSCIAISNVSDESYTHICTKCEHALMVSDAPVCQLLKLMLKIYVYKYTRTYDSQDKRECQYKNKEPRAV